MTPDQVQQILDQWVQAGWLREMDRAFSAFLQQLEADAPAELLLAAALASHQLGRGHICLDLAAVLQQPDQVLGWMADRPEPTVPLEPPRSVLAGLILADWVAALQRSSLVTSGAGASPLVLEADHLYLRRYWRYEQQIAHSIRERLSLPTAYPADIRSRLDALFPARTSGGPDWQKIACAVAARSHFSVITGGPGTGKTFSVVRLLALLQGAALDQGQALRIELAAPTGKAAARLTEAIGKAIAATQLPELLIQALPQKASTLHRLLGARPGTRHLRFNRKNPLQADLVIVDEASMIDLEMMAALLEALPNRTRLVLLGDKDQLASVEAGAVLGSLCAANTGNAFSPATPQWLTEVTGESLAATPAATSALAQQVVMLTESRRFTAQSGIGELARAVNTGSPDRLQRLWASPTPYPDIANVQVQSPTDALLRSLVLDGRPANFPTQTTTTHSGGPQGYRHYLTVLREQRPVDPTDRAARDQWAQGVLAAFDQFRVLCALRAGPWGVEGLNAVIAQQLHTAQLIDKTTDWYEGRPVLITRNDYALGLMNGDIGVTLRLPDDSNPPQAEYSGGLRVVFLQPDGSLKFVLPSRLTDIETVYAMTVHKSQGSEFTHVALVLPDTLSQVLTRELVYTGITRAKQWCSVVLSDAAVLAQAVTRKVRRSGRLALIL